MPVYFALTLMNNKMELLENKAYLPWCLSANFLRSCTVQMAFFVHNDGSVFVRDLQDCRLSPSCLIRPAYVYIGAPDVGSSGEQMIDGSICVSFPHSQ